MCSPSVLFFACLFGVVFCSKVWPPYLTEPSWAWPSALKSFLVALGFLGLLGDQEIVALWWLWGLLHRSWSIQISCWSVRGSFMGNLSCTTKPATHMLSRIGELSSSSIDLAWTNPALEPITHVAWFKAQEDEASCHQASIQIASQPTTRLLNVAQRKGSLGGAVKLQGLGSASSYCVALQSATTRSDFVLFRTSSSGNRRGQSRFTPMYRISEFTNDVVNN